MKGEGIIWEDIKIAMLYRDKYANRDMMTMSLANELGIGRGAAARLITTAAKMR
jgi:hypothetical protein